MILPQDAAAESPACRLPPLPPAAAAAGAAAADAAAAAAQIDQDGQPYSDTDLKDGWSLLYFGFTFCPDICPNELNKITVVVDALDKSWKAGPILQPVLITVDPRRDSAPKMKEYIKQFHPRFIGLTGSEEQVRKVTKAYRVYFNPTNDDDENYLVRRHRVPSPVSPASAPLGRPLSVSAGGAHAANVSSRLYGTNPAGGPLDHRLPAQPGG